MELRDDLEDCDDIEPDFYGEKTTTVARARLCGQCIHYTIENQLLTCIRCKLGLRPSVTQDANTKKWLAKCPKFQSRKAPQ